MNAVPPNEREGRDQWVTSAVKAGNVNSLFLIGAFDVLDAAAAKTFVHSHSAVQMQDAGGGGWSGKRVENKSKASCTRVDSACT